MNFESPFAAPICEHLGIKYPIVQAGMGFVASGGLAGAVCNAGGPRMRWVGDLASHQLKEQTLRRRELLDRSLGGVNLFCRLVADQAMRAFQGGFSCGGYPERLGP